MEFYNPPNSHYRHFSCPEEWAGLMPKIIGKEGRNFIFLTEKCGVRYIWHDVPNNRVEIWGPHNRLMQAEKRLRRFANKVCSQ